MELSNRNNDFQTQLKQINFKTFYHNQIQTFGYDDLFASKRVLIFSITYGSSSESTIHYNKFDSLYNDFLNHGIDNVYSINSRSLLFAVRAEKVSKKIIGLLDNNCEFVTALGKIYYPDYDPIGLGRAWQYVVCLNDGVPELLWSNGYKPNLSLRILKSSGYQYRKIGPEIILDHFKNSVDTK